MQKGQSPKDWLKDLMRDEDGQAVVEYVLSISVALGVVTIVGLGFRKTLFAIWQTFAREISAACPSCPADPDIRIR